MLVYLELGRQRASLNYRDLSSKEEGEKGEGGRERRERGKNGEEGRGGTEREEGDIRRGRKISRDFHHITKTGKLG